MGDKRPLDGLLRSLSDDFQREDGLMSRDAEYTMVLVRFHLRSGQVMEAEIAPSAVRRVSKAVAERKSLGDDGPAYDRWLKVSPRCFVDLSDVSGFIILG